KIHARAAQLHTWTESLAAELRTLGVHTYPTHTYFFLADFAPHDAAQLAEALKAKGILIKPLNDPMLGNGFMRITTALPKENARFLGAIKELLAMRPNKALHTDAP
ncbi:MAG: aminotransferase class I/II-fold pyridoxal phosphate-dependent enzyme, partial [Proteobacteria bacterium]|nr:aminotransferase class I/II-fold pyridoxal phosphate-dependent enzyme [Pseudomonadota bacterium]